VFRGGTPEIFIIYLSDCSALVRIKELVVQFTGWKNEDASANEDLLLHDINKPKLNATVTDKDAIEDYAASSKVFDKTSKK